MKKENVLVLVEKKHKGGTRTHLLSLANNPTPYVVCSNYQENDYNTCSWDWGHYHTNITSALFTLFDYDIKSVFSLEDSDIQDYINYFEYSSNYVPEDRPKLSIDQKNILPDIILFINVELEKNCKSSLKLG